MDVDVDVDIGAEVEVLEEISQPIPDGGRSQEEKGLNSTLDFRPFLPSLVVFHTNIGPPNVSFLLGKLKINSFRRKEYGLSIHIAAMDDSIKNESKFHFFMVWFMDKKRRIDKSS